MNATEMTGMLYEVGTRIKALREIAGYSVVYMAEQTKLDVETYMMYEAGKADLPFTFIHNCARIFGVDITDLIEGRSANLRSYTVTRKGEATITAKEEGIVIGNLAPLFSKKIAEPFWVTYSYSEELQNQEIHTHSHPGQEFDLILSGELLVRIGDHVEHLREGEAAPEHCAFDLNMKAPEEYGDFLKGLGVRHAAATGKICGRPAGCGIESVYAPGRSS